MKEPNVYRTMDSDYEAAEVGIFKDMVQKGFIFRGRKPVFWSPSTRTALAESELEYEDDHNSKSVYVAFPLSATNANAAAQQLIDEYKNISLVIWTTTPWTLPANVAICVSPNIDYSIVADANQGRNYIIASTRVEEICKTIGKQLRVVGSIKGSEIVGSICKHPIIEDQTSVVLGGSHVTVDSGTGLVHTAPGHGADDYIVCQENNITTIPMYVDDGGRYDSSTPILELQGKSVQGEGNELVVEMLESSGNLLFVHDYKHRYPYDWRSKKPIIMRATQ